MKNVASHSTTTPETREEFSAKWQQNAQSAKAKVALSVTAACATFWGTISPRVTLSWPSSTSGCRATTVRAIVPANPYECHLASQRCTTTSPAVWHVTSSTTSSPSSLAAPTMTTTPTAAPSSLTAKPPSARPSSPSAGFRNPSSTTTSKSICGEKCTILFYGRPFHKNRINATHKIGMIFSLFTIIFLSSFNFSLFAIILNS